MSNMLHGRLESIKINGVTVYRRQADTAAVKAVPNVVGGSLDGAAIPNGTRDGQQLTWNYNRQRWIG